MGKSSYPIVNIGLIPANIVDAFRDRNDLLVGQIYTDVVFVPSATPPTAVSGQLYEDVQTLDNTEIATLFGSGGELTNRIYEYLEASSRQVKLSVIPIADAADAPTGCAQGTIYLYGTCTKAGTIKISLADEYKFTFEVDVEVNTSDTDVAADAITIINQSNDCPIKAAAHAGSLISLYAKNSGKIGDSYGLKVDVGAVEGFEFYIERFHNGGDNPSLTGIFDVLGEKRVTGIGWPEGWDGLSELSILKDFLEARFDANNAITDGIGFVGHSDTYANNKAFVTAYNSPVLVIAGNNAHAFVTEFLKAFTEITRLNNVSTATTVEAAHNLKTGDVVYINGTLPVSFEGIYRITVTGADTFTYDNPGDDESTGGTPGGYLLSDNLYGGPIILKPADYVLAGFMGIRSKRLTEGALISQDIVARNGLLDNVGGPALASLPYFNTPDRRAKVPEAISETYDSIEEEDLLNSGLTVFGVNSAGNTIIFRAVVTTYKTDGPGNPNVSFKYLNYVDTGSVCREILFNNVKSQFAQSRLTTGKLKAGRNMENAASIKAHYLSILKDLGDLALLESGVDAEYQMSQQTLVSVDTANRSASVSGPILLVTQLAKITYNLQFQFAVEEA